MKFLITLLPMKTKKKIFVLIVFVFSMFAAACSSRNDGNSGDSSDPFLDWSYANILLLEDAVSENPEQDLLAAYARQFEKTFEIRLDFLEISDQIGLVNSHGNLI